MDIYRDTPLRYLGYANELAECFRYILPWSIKVGYTLAFSYVFADTLDKAKKQYEMAGNKFSRRLFVQTGDVFIWQILASVCLPGYVIHQLVKVSKMILPMTGAIGHFGPTVIGLASIPFIVHPIDNFVDFVMDNTYRKYLN